MDQHSMISTGTYPLRANRGLHLVMSSGDSGIRAAAPTELTKLRLVQPGERVARRLGPRWLGTAKAVYQILVQGLPRL